MNTTTAIEHLNASLLRGRKPQDFTAVGTSYTKAEADARYSQAKLVMNANFFGVAPADMSEVEATTLPGGTLPCTGTLTLTVALEESSDPTTQVRLYVGGVLRGVTQTGPAGGTIFFAVSTPPPGPLDYSIKVKSTDATAGSAAGNVVAVLYPWC